MEADGIETRGGDWMTRGAGKFMFMAICCGEQKLDWFVPQRSRSDIYGRCAVNDMALICLFLRAEYLSHPGEVYNKEIWILLNVWVYKCCSKILKESQHFYEVLRSSMNCTRVALDFYKILRIFIKFSSLLHGFLNFIYIFVNFVRSSLLNFDEFSWSILSSLNFTEVLWS